MKEPDRQRSDAQAAPETVETLALAAGSPPRGRPDLGPRYSVEERLGQGAHATVWRAVDRELERTVAIKVLHDTDPVMAEAFLAEARALARLDHEGILPIHEIGTMADGRPWLSMPVVQAATLQERIGAMPTLEAVARVLACAEAVAHAHTAGLVHRDLKPANLLAWGADGGRVIDWGLVRLPGREEPGGIRGTPGYMAPEQARGQTEEIGPWTDVYGLGATLLHVLVGRRPRHALDVAWLEGHAEPELAAIVRRAMRVDAADRYRDAGELAEALRTWLHSAREEAQAARQNRRLEAWYSDLPAGAGVRGALLRLHDGQGRPRHRDVRALGPDADRLEQAGLIRVDDHRAALIEPTLAQRWTRLASWLEDGHQAVRDEICTEASLWHLAGRTRHRLAGRATWRRAQSIQPTLLEADWLTRSRSQHLRTRTAQLAASAVAVLVVVLTGAWVVQARLSDAAAVADARDDALLRLELAQGALAVQAGAEHRALLHFERALARDPTHPEARTHQARLSARLGELVRFDGHTGHVWDVASAPDGRVITASADGTVRLWDAANGKEVGRFTAGAPQLELDVGAGGSRVLTRAADGQRHLLSLPDLVPVGLTLPASRAVALHPHRDEVAVGAGSDLQRVLDGQAHDLASLGAPIAHLAWSLDGDALLAIQETGEAVVLEGTGARVSTSELTGPIRAIAWSPGSDRVAVAHGDHVSVLSRTGRRAASRRVTGIIDELAWHAEGSRLAVSTRRGVVVLATDADADAELVELTRLRTGSTTTWSATWWRDQIASADEDGRVRLWDPRSEQIIETLGGHERGARAVVVDDSALLTTDRTGGARRWVPRRARAAERTVCGEARGHRGADSRFGGVVVVRTDAGWCVADATTPEGRLVGGEGRPVTDSLGRVVLFEDGHAWPEGRPEHGFAIPSAVADFRPRGSLHRGRVLLMLGDGEAAVVDSGHVVWTAAGVLEAYTRGGDGFVVRTRRGALWWSMDEGELVQSGPIPIEPAVGMVVLRNRLFVGHHDGTVAWWSADGTHGTVPGRLTDKVGLISADARSGRALACDRTGMCLWLDAAAEPPELLAEVDTGAPSAILLGGGLAAHHRAGRGLDVVDLRSGRPVLDLVYPATPRLRRPALVGGQLVVIEPGRSRLTSWPMDSRSR